MDRHEAETKQIQAFLAAKCPLGAILVKYRPVFILMALILLAGITGARELWDIGLEVGKSMLISAN